MTGTHAVSVEGVNFSGIFVELWKKKEKLSSVHTGVFRAYKQFTPDKYLVESRGSKQIPNTWMCFPEKCLVGSKMVSALINEC